MTRNEKLYAMSFYDLLPNYFHKAERKGRTKEEVLEIIYWLTGYNETSFQAQLDKKSNLRTFFDEAPMLNPNVSLITGTICGVKLATIEDPLMKKIRYLDKLIDELAKGKSMEKILRKQ
ncbi:DUF2200 domain-containing protein [Liberiplasma polymorphum]|uniref:DUF2200 domain-containing protein n=1 Tax=Liberiplasma polymorphum TaxID=3374570 RepID=UPI003770D104